MRAPGTSTDPASRAGGWLALALGLILAVAQGMVTVSTTEIGTDGGYYTDVAMHVRDGDGLVTDVSLYHAGFEHFPHASPIYPLWPLLYGHVLRLAPVRIAAHWLPYACYVVSLFAAWQAGRRIAPGPLLGLRVFNGGHLLMFMLGAQQEYSKYAARPYTEALAFALLMITVWRASRIQGPGLGPMLELGAWMALCCLTRSQHFIVPIAAAIAFGLVALRSPEPRRWLLGGAASLGVVAVGLLTWWASLRDAVNDPGLFTMFRFDQAQANDILSPIDVIADTEGPVHLLLDRLSGVAWAFDPLGWRFSYARGFYTLHWALPAAGIVGLPLLVRLRLAGIRTWLGEPRAFLLLFVGLIGLGALASVHLPHKADFGAWYFYRRHAIVVVVAFFACTAFLLALPARLPRLLGGAVVVSALGFAAHGFYARIDLSVAPRDEDRQLVSFLQEKVERSGPVVVALQAFQPPELAWRTDGVGYHWFYERTSLGDLVKMFDQLGAELLIYRHRDTEGWLFHSNKETFRAAFVPTRDHPSGYAVYRRRGAADVAE